MAALRLTTFAAFNLGVGGGSTGFGYRLQFTLNKDDIERKFVLYLRGTDAASLIVGRREVESDCYDEQKVPRTLRRGTDEYSEACQMLTAAVAMVATRDNAITLDGERVEPEIAVSDPAWQTFERMVALALAATNVAT